jgi:FkbM family methyltransferase
LKLQLARAQALLKQSKPKPDEAMKVLQPLVNRKNAPWPVYHYSGIAFLQKKEYATALSFLQESVRQGADEPETHHSISICYFNLGSYDEAEEHAQIALDKKPEFFKGWLHLGSLYRAQAKLDDALKCFQKANAIDPKSASVAYRIGEIYNDQGDINKAYELYDIATQIDKKYTDAWLAMAQVERHRKHYEQAEECINKVLKQKPKSLAARVELGEHFKHIGNYEKAINLYEKLIQEFPKVGGIRVNYALCLQELGRFDESEKHYMTAFEHQPESFESLSNYLMGIHYNPDRTKEEIFKAHKLWDKHFAPQVKQERPVPSDTSKDKRIRVGFISGGFRMHPVGWMITKALEHLSKGQFEIYCYTTNNKFDQITRRIHEVTDKWQSVIGYNDAVIARMIKEDEIDILFELSGHSADTRLKTVALEPAPVIVKWVGGLFNTTGLKSVDYLITDHYETPAGEEKFYTEKLVRMPDDYVTFMPPEYAPEVGELPVVKNGYVTFGCFNNPTKVNDEILNKWAGIMKDLPSSRLFLKSKQYDTEALRERIIRTMEQNGVEADRIRFEGLSPHNELLDRYNEVDIALDPWPYSGGLTTCEALWMGVPVITKPGPTFAGRHSTTHLINAGLPELVTNSWDTYKKKVIELASDTQQLAELRSSLREQVTNSPIYDGQRFGAHLSSAIRQMWYQWVDGYKNGEKDWQQHIDVEPLKDSEIKAYEKRSDRSDDRLEMVDDLENEFSEKSLNGNGSLSPENGVNGTVSKNGAHTNSVEKTSETDTNGKQQTENISGPYKIEIKDGVTICTPPDLNLMTPYVLLEQEQWYENEVDFIREYLKSGMNVLDVGAGFGVYSLPAAKLVGDSGKVFSFEPGATSKKYLEMSKLENGFDHLEVIGKALSDKNGKQHWHVDEAPEMNRLDDSGEECVSVVTLDAWWQFDGEPKVDLIKVDINGDESKALVGAEQLLTDQSPVVLISVAEQNSDMFTETLSDLGYSLYEYIPGSGILAEHDEQAGTDPYMQILIAVKDDRVESLKEDGWFHDESVDIAEIDDNLWKAELSKRRWTHSLMETWEKQGNSDGIKSYLQALNYLITAEKIDSHNSGLDQPKSQKTGLMIGAARILINLYNQGADSTSVVFTLVRSLNALGKRGQAVEVMQKLIESTKFGQENMNVDLPFMLPVPEQDEAPIKTTLNKWLMVRTVEAWIHMKDVTTYLSGPQEQKLMEVLEGNVEVVDGITNRNRHLNDNCLPKSDEGFTSISSNEKEIPFFRSERIDLIDVAEESYSYSDENGVAVIMPCIDKTMGVETAEILVKRAGIPCKVVVAFDSNGEGFMNTLNKVARQINVRYVVYLAQDAFPGMHWLKKAFDKLEETGKGLLGFNDGKWNGVIASFGMVRVNWVTNLYNGSILCPEYKSHCADDELTAIARSNNQYVYDPNVSLFEIDLAKGLTGGGNQRDRKLLYERFSTCFEGLAPRKELLKISSQYSVKPSSISVTSKKDSRAGIVKQSKLEDFEPIIVVGMHRSGTSLLSRVLSDMGVFMGNDLSINHESMFFQKLNVKIFDELGGRWDAPPDMNVLLDDDSHLENVVSFLKKNLKRRQFTQFLHPFKNLDSLEKNNNRAWGWKDPRNVYTLPIWLKLFPKAKVIFIKRHGVDVAMSLRKRAIKEADKVKSSVQISEKNKGLSSFSSRCSTLEGGLELWNEYNYKAEETLKRLNNSSYLKLEYENLLSNSDQVINVIRKFLGEYSLSKECTISFDESRAFAFRKDSDLLAFAQKNMDKLNNYEGIILPVTRSNQGLSDHKAYLDSGVEQINFLKEYHLISRNSKILDFGCGQGRLLNSLKYSKTKFSKYTGLDTSEDSIKWCQKYLAKSNGIEFIHLPAENARYNPNVKGLKHLPFENNEFDLIFLNSVFSHMLTDHITFYLSEFYKVLKNGGSLYLTAFIEENVPSVQENPNNYLSKSSGALHRVRYEKNYFFELIKNAKFEFSSFHHQIITRTHQSVVVIKKL